MFSNPNQTEQFGLVQFGFWFDPNQATPNKNRNDILTVPPLQIYSFTIKAKISNRRNNLNVQNRRTQC